MPWKWIGAFAAIAMAYVVVVVVAVSTTRLGRQQRTNFPIAGVLYSWPDGTTITPPQPPGIYGKGYVRYYPRQDGFRLIYDGDQQEPQNEAGLPHLQQITSRFARRDGFSFYETTVGTVVCHKKLARVGSLFPCGLSFMHRGARWQLHFAASEATNAEELHRLAVSRLEAFRSRDAHAS